MKRTWKRWCALIVVWAYAYALLIHPALVWLCVFLTAFSAQLFGAPVAFPVPPEIHETLLLTGTLQLVSIGGIEVMKKRNPQPEGEPV